MSDDVKHLVTEIKDEKLKKHLKKIIEISEKIEKLEKINNNVEKLMREIVKLEKGVKQVEFNKLDDKNREKLKKNIQKILNTINKLLNEFKKINEKTPKNIDLEQDNINKVTKNISQALENLVNSIPPQIMDSIQPQLQNIANTLQQLQQATAQDLQIKPQQENLQNTLNKINQLMNQLQKTETNTITKKKIKEIQKMMKNLTDKIKNGENINMDDISKIEKKLSELQHKHIKQYLDKISEVKKELNKRFNEIGTNNIKQNLNDLKNILNSLKEEINKDTIPKDPNTNKAIKNLENFIKNPQLNTIPTIKKSIKNSNLQPQLKNDIINKLDNIQQTGKNIKNHSIKNLIKDIGNANSKISKVKNNQLLTKDIKDKLDKAQKLLNQSMFNPNKTNIEKALNNLKDAITKIKDSELSNTTKANLLQQLEEATNSAQDAKQITENIKKLNDLKMLINSVQEPQSQLFNSQQGLQGQAPNLIPGEKSTQQGGAWNNVQKQGEFHGDNTLGESGIPSPGNINQVVETIQSLTNTVAQSMQEEIRNLMNSLTELSPQQLGEGNGNINKAQDNQQNMGTQYSMDNRVIQQALTNIMNLQSLANSLQNGSVSPNAIQQGIQQLQQLANILGIDQLTESTIKNVMNNFQNLQTLNQLMENTNTIPSITSQISSMLNQILSSILGGEHISSDAQTQLPKKESTTQGKQDSKVNLPGEGFLSQEIVDMLNKLSNTNLTASQRKRFTKLVKDVLKLAKDVAKRIEKNVSSMQNQEKWPLLQNLGSAIKNNLHNLDIDDELLDLAQQFDDALNQDYSSGLSGGMYASTINDIEKVDINEAMNKLVKMNKEWIKNYKDLFNKLITDIIELKTKEIGYHITSHGRKIDYRRTVRKTVYNAGIPYIVKKDRDKAIGDFIFVLDASGSMYETVQLENAPWSQKQEIKNRLNNRITQYQIGLITAYVLGEAIRRVGEGDYKIIVFANKMVDLTNVPLDVILYLINTPEELSKYIGGGTNLRPVILEIIKNYINESMNVVLFTDTGDMSVWDTFTLTRLKENSKKVGVFCAKDFFDDTAHAFARANIPVFSFNSFDELFEIMKQYYIADLEPEQAIAEVKEYLERKKKEGKEIKSVLPSMN